MLTRLVTNVIFGTKKNCRLCFSEAYEDDLRFHDELLVNSETEKISTVLTYLLGGKYTSNMSVSDSFCSQCVHLMRNSYCFMKMCKNNSDRFDTVISVLNEALKNTENLKSSESVLIQVDITDNSYMQFYRYRKSVGDLPALCERRPKHEIARKETAEINSTENSFDMSHETHETIFQSDTEMPCETKGTTSLKTQHLNLKNIIKKSVNLVEKRKKQETKKRFKSDPMKWKNKYKVDLSHTHTQKDSKPAILKKEKKFECSDCCKVYYCRGSIKYHLSSKHSSEYICKYCEKPFQTKNILMDHVTRKHLHCDLCGLNFDHYNALCAHRKKHSNPRSKVFIKPA